MGFGGYTNQRGPHLLLIGQTQKTGGVRHWGVPGGFSDRGDNGDATYTATRELLEEMGIHSHPSETQIKATQLLLVNKGLQTVIPTNNSGFSAHAVVFDTALQFEKAMGLTKVLRDRKVLTTPTLVHKYDVRLSRETQGYTYVPLPLDTATVRNHKNELYRAVRSVAELNSRQLRLRRGISMRAIREVLRMV